MDDLQIARGLGWFSLGLGATEFAAPAWLGTKIGVGANAKGTLRAFGAREIGAGMAVLRPKRPGTALWGRVGGDALDLLFLVRALRRSAFRGRVIAAIAAVAGVTLLDVIYARRFSD